jgi:hypothetical protein
MLSVVSSDADLEGGSIPITTPEAESPVEEPCECWIPGGRVAFSISGLIGVLGLEKWRRNGERSRGES